jgi:hypothetical protein
MLPSFAMINLAFTLLIYLYYFDSDICEQFSELENFLVITLKNCWGSQCMNITMLWTVRLLRRASKAVSTSYFCHPKQS